MRRIAFWPNGSIAAVGLLLASACGGGEERAPASAPPPGAVRVDASTAGNLKGRILFEGTAPVNPLVRVAADPICARENAGGLRSETIIVSGGGLDNVFVYVKDGLDKYHFDAPAAAAVLDQHGCRYLPHVMGLRVGQPLEIRNSDDTMHNVNALAKVNRGFNLGQPVKGRTDTRTFTAPEVMVLFKCDVHPWMNAYVGVVDHPYYAVSADGGAFELKNLPPGTYTVEAWHEKLGTRAQSVTIAGKATTDVTFTFGPAAR